MNSIINLKRTASDLIAKGDAARDARDWLTAATYYAAALEEDSGNAAIWVQLGNMRKEAGDYAGSEQAYKRALALQPKNSDTHLQMGHLYKKMGRQSTAADCYRSALLHDPSNYDAYRELENLGLAKAADNIVQRTSPSRNLASQIVFDVSDLVYYIGHHAHLTGIQRVQCSIILSIIRHSLFDAKSIQFISYDQVDRAFRVISGEKFVELLEDLTLPDESRVVTFNREEAKVGRLFPAAALSSVVAKGNSTIVLLGAAWVIPEYPNIIANLKRNFDVRFAMVFHDFIPIYARETCDQGTAEVFQVFIDQMLDYVDLALCVSQNTANDLSRYCQENGYDMPTTVITRLGSGFSEFLSKRAQDEEVDLSCIPQEPYVLFVSTIEGRKNHAYLLRIWRLLQEQGVDVPKLVCVGRPGWRSETFLKSLLSAHSLSWKVDILDNVSDAQLERLYESCLFTVYPSLYEGWGLPVGESLAHGKVCVLSDRASLPEVAGEHGIYIPLDDPSTAAAQIRELVEKPATLRAHEKRLRERYEPITWKSVAIKVLEGCAKVRAAEKRLPFPVISLGTEYPIRKLQANTDGLMGQELMQAVVAAHRNVILDGIASPRTRVQALAARDDRWYPAESWGCWSNGMRASLDFALNGHELDEAKSLIFYFALQFLPGRPRSRMLLSTGSRITEARAVDVHQERQLMTLCVPANDISSRAPVRDRLVPVKVTMELSIDGMVTPPPVSKDDNPRLGFGLRSFLVLRDDDLDRRLKVLENQSFTPWDH